MTTMTATTTTAGFSTQQAARAATAAPLPTRPALTLDQQREAFACRRFLAMPLAGTLAWTAVAAAGAFLTPKAAMLVLYMATGLIAWLGILISRLTGENFIDKTRPKNEFDALFLTTIAMTVVVYAISLPFAMRDPTSLAMSIGIQTGLMWLPLSWIIRHWVGVAHTVVRTVGVLAAWLAFPAHRTTAVALVIVAVYAVTIVVLERRWRALPAAAR